MVPRFGVDNRNEDLLDRRPDRQFGVHTTHELAIERLAFRCIDLGRRIVDDLVDLRVSPVPLVGPWRALRLAGAIPYGRRDRGIVAILMPAAGEIEGVIVVDLLEEAPAVVAHDV